MRLAALVATLLLSTAACGNHAAEKQASQSGTIAVKSPGPAPADNGIGDNTGSVLTPGTTSEPPMGSPDQNGENDRPASRP